MEYGNICKVIVKLTWLWKKLYFDKQHTGWRFWVLTLFFSINFISAIGRYCYLLVHYTGISSVWQVNASNVWGETALHCVFKRSNVDPTSRTAIVAYLIKVCNTCSLTQRISSPSFNIIFPSVAYRTGIRFMRVRI